MTTTGTRPSTPAEDLIITALEGGSNYWIDDMDVPAGDVPVEFGECLAVRFAYHCTKPEGPRPRVYVGAEEGDPRWIELPADGVERATKLLQDPALDVARSIVSRLVVELMVPGAGGAADAVDADVFLQLIAFGEVVYG